MFRTSILAQNRIEQSQDADIEPFGSELFQMMAASTAGLAFGGPDRMLFEPPKVHTSSTKTETPLPPPAIAKGDVKGWYQYDPQTEDFRQSSVDEGKEQEEQVAAQTLVNVCERAMSGSSTIVRDHEQDQDAGLLRASFSFIVCKESKCISSPSASPFSGGYGSARQVTPPSVTNGGVSPSKGAMRFTALTVDSSSKSSPSTLSSSSSSTIINDAMEHGTSSLEPLPQRRETRLASHRGSVMEAGVVLDSRIFGGISLVQDGRKVGVRKSEGRFHLAAAVGEMERDYGR